MSDTVTIKFLFKQTRLILHTLLAVAYKDSEK